MVLTETRIPISTRLLRFPADTITPVMLYLQARDHFTEPVLLENNDFRSREDCFSFLGFDRIAGFQVQNGQIREYLPDGTGNVSPVVDTQSVPEALHTFLRRFNIQEDSGTPAAFNGLIGYTAFESVQYFDTHSFESERPGFDLPDIRFNLYRFVVAFNHFRDDLTILENIPPGETSQMGKMEALIRSRKISTHAFRLLEQEESNLSDEAFRELVATGKRHCQRGDVFQIVFSRQFRRRFAGDDFQVYRALRSINPSPYLFYADFGGYRIFGSSPETQMSIRQGIAQVNPIAGTYRRTGDPAVDAQKAKDLLEDPKENAEHIMLVDLARNDLGRHAANIQVKNLRDIQYFSHVMHLVSRVTGELEPGANPVQVFADTFPAGTLSGAPKYKAIELIHRYENQQRFYYGGALGYLQFNGDVNMAIVIRSFLSRHNTLYYQAGAGVVAASNEESELQEVHNKLNALRKALNEAERLH